MKRFLALLFAVPALLAACGEKIDPKVEEQEQKKALDHIDLRIMSFNVAVDNRQEDKGWEWRKNAVYSMMTEQKATIIGFQEAQAHEITGMLKAHPEYSWYGLGRDTGIKPSISSEAYSAEESMSVFWLKDSLTVLDKGTIWLSETPEKVSKGWDAAYNRTLTWLKFRHKLTGTEFFVFNTHLDHKGKTARKESMALIISKMVDLNQGFIPAFLMADFNAASTDGLFNDLKSLMSSARDKAAFSEKDKMTFNNYTNVGKSQIDHIFFSGDNLSALTFRVLDANYGNIYISDHYPIVSDFRLKLEKE